MSTVYKEITNNNLVRWLILRNYFYISRVKHNGKYVSYFIESPLLNELLEIYYKERKNGLGSTYVEKTTQIAE